MGASTRRVFVSHITQEAPVALALKSAIDRDFLGLVEVFVSSDIESIDAGDDWFDTIATALQDAALVIVLCSPASVGRPWVNFEAGAAWILNKTIVPLCHAGLTPGQLPAPLSRRQGGSINDPEYLRQVYKRIADGLSPREPQADYAALAGTLAGVDTPRRPAADVTQGEAAIWARLAQALDHPKHLWRTVEWVAVEAGVSEEVAAAMLRANENVRFSKGKSGKPLVGWISRVGPAS